MLKPAKILLIIELTSMYGRAVPGLSCESVAWLTRQLSTGGRVLPRTSWPALTVFPYKPPAEVCASTLVRKVSKPIDTSMSGKPRDLASLLNRSVRHNLRLKAPFGPLYLVARSRSPFIDNWASQSLFSASSAIALDRNHGQNVTRSGWPLT